MQQEQKEMEDVTMLLSTAALLYFALKGEDSNLTLKKALLQLISEIPDVVLEEKKGESLTENINPSSLPVTSKKHSTKVEESHIEETSDAERNTFELFEKTKNRALKVISTMTTLRDTTKFDVSVYTNLTEDQATNWSEKGENLE